MKIKLICVALLCSPLAWAETTADIIQPLPPRHTFYVKAEGGVAVPQKSSVRVVFSSPQGQSTIKSNIKYRQSFVGGLGVGYNFKKLLSAEVMSNQRFLENQSGESILSGNFGTVLNMYLHAQEGIEGSIFMPYITGGAGFYKIRIKGESMEALVDDTVVTASIPKKTITNAIWNVGVGARGSVSDRLDVDFKYRYVDLGKIKINISASTGTAQFKTRLISHELVVGVMYKL